MTSEGGALVFPRQARLEFNQAGQALAEQYRVPWALPRSCAYFQHISGTEYSVHSWTQWPLLPCQPLGTAQPPVTPERFEHSELLSLLSFCLGRSIAGQPMPKRLGSCLCEIEIKI
ncbi:predicted protein [Coccidioides posadasii str. Silveira]|uniref:Predicted protein n=1 Tax=Coccidioides posadasii (strain RMSCC 757 / Silveira) TaxID=443226 RepID=E9CWK5_COCPS|nr:predicted protein [Coccidioides posadasii str. Silveira]